MNKEIGKPEIAVGAKVKILASAKEEYDQGFEGKTGEVLRIIRPNPNKSPDFTPSRATVKLSERLLVNFRIKDLAPVEASEKK